MQTLLLCVGVYKLVVDVDVVDFVQKCPNVCGAGWRLLVCGLRAGACSVVGRSVCVDPGKVQQFGGDVYGGSGARWVFGGGIDGIIGRCSSRTAKLECLRQRNNGDLCTPEKAET